jgi:hypothetical protein
MSLQSTVNGLMKTGSTDAYLTRIWSTCSKMLTINSIKEKVKDLFFVVNDSTLPLPNVLEYVQFSSEQMLVVSVVENKDEIDSLGELYAHFLIEGHSHTTHYVNMAEEFPIDKDVDTRVAAVLSRCSRSVEDTNIIVLVDISLKKKDTATPPPNQQSSTSSDLQRHLQAKTLPDGSAVSELVLSPARILKKLLEKLLVDGGKTVVILADSAETMVFTSLFEEVSLSVKQVCIYLLITN